MSALRSDSRWPRLLDGLPALSTGMLMIGWAFVPPGTWLAVAIAVPALALAVVSLLLLILRKERAPLHAVVVALARDVVARKAPPEPTAAIRDEAPNTTEGAPDA